MTGKRFKPPFIRDRRVILADIEYAEQLLKNNHDDKKLKKFVQECEDELIYTKPSLFEMIFKRR